jgi:hypothetical protein
MEFLGDVGHGESYFSPFGDGVSVDARWTHLMELLGDVALLESCFGS